MQSFWDEPDATPGQGIDESDPGGASPTDPGMGVTVNGGATPVSGIAAPYVIAKNKEVTEAMRRAGVTGPIRDSEGRWWGDPGYNGQEPNINLNRQPPTNGPSVPMGTLTYGGMTPGGYVPPSGYTTGYSGGPYPLSSVSGPGLMAPFSASFQAPNGTDDPGFAFAIGEGQKGIERSAAAKGTLLTGGTLKDLANYSTGMALRGYDDAWRRAMGLYETSAGIYDRNRQFQYDALGNLGRTGANMASSYGNQITDLTTGAANARAAGTAANGQIWGDTVASLGDLAGGVYAYGRGRRAPVGRTSNSDLIGPGLAFGYPPVN